MTLSAIIITGIAVIVLAGMFVFALIGAMAMVDFARFNRREVDDKPPASWLAKQDRGE